MAKNNFYSTIYISKYAARHTSLQTNSSTGKERDEETGYGYFGARYMDHELMTIWLSADPMADKYPNLSPYSYCAWNPMKLVDPDGRDTFYYNLDGHCQFVKRGGSDINMMIVSRNNVPEASFNEGDYYAFNVDEIDFGKMNQMYNRSAQRGANEWYYSVCSDGTSTEPVELGPYGGKVVFADNDKYNVHTHALDNAKKAKASNIYPSKDRDCVGIGDRFGIILGYKKKQTSLSGAVISNVEKEALDSDYIRYVSFYDKNGIIKDCYLSYNQFKSKVQKVQQKKN